MRGEAEEAVVVVGADMNERRDQGGRRGRSVATCNQRRRMNGWLAGWHRHGRAHSYGPGWVLQLGGHLGYQRYAGALAIALDRGGGRVTGGS